MTTTTTRRTAAHTAEPWPTRRERDGGVRTRAAGTAERPSGLPARRAPRHAAPEPAAAPIAAGPEDRPVTAGPIAAAPAVPVPAGSDGPFSAGPVALWTAGGDPDVTERLAVLVPAQRTAAVRPSPTPRATPAPSVAPVPAAPAPAVADAPVAEPVSAPAVASAPHPTPWRPAPTPCPPRPAVGSAVHEVRPAPRTVRNGLGVAAACLGSIGLPLGLVPVTGFVAAGLGVLALAFGIAGWSRVRSGTASNRGTAVTGAVLGLIALGLGVAGTIAFVRAPDRLVYDLDALTASTTSAVAVTPSGE